MSMQRLLEALPRHTLRELWGTRKVGEPIREPRQAGGSSCTDHKFRIRRQLCLQGEGVLMPPQNPFTLHARSSLSTLVRFVELA